jgi:hypothetical protein
VRFARRSYDNMGQFLKLIDIGPGHTKGITAAKQTVKSLEIPCGHAV